MKNMINKNKGFTLIKGLVCVAIVFILIGIIFGSASGCNVNVSDGFRVGTISKFTNKGIFKKSWEGELIMGGVINKGESGTVANLWRFSTLDKKIADEINQAASSGKKVKITYHQTFIRNPFVRDTTYLVKSVEILDGKVEN